MLQSHKKLTRSFRMNSSLKKSLSYLVRGTLSVIVLGSMNAQAKIADKAYFDGAFIKVEAFKDPTSVQMPEQAKDRRERFNQVVVVKEDNEIVQAFKVSTGVHDLDANSIETPNGYFSFHKVAREFLYFNRSGSVAREPWGLYFFDPAELDPRQASNDRRNQAAMHSYPSAQVTGNRESHGCIRVVERNQKELWERINGLSGGRYAALAVYGRALAIQNQNVSAGAFLVKPEVPSQAEVNEVLALLGK